MGRLRACFLILLFSSMFFLPTASPRWAQEMAPERILFIAKVFTGHPYAEAVAIRGENILAVGNLTEVLKAASPNAERIDLDGKSLFPGFIDSHSHSIDGGIALISADTTDKVDKIEQLPAFVVEAKKSGRGMRGDIIEILGLPLEFWSHLDFLNTRFSTGDYEKQSVLLRGSDGHTAWANHALLQRAGITSEYLKKLSVQERSYFGFDKNLQPNGFLVNAGTARIEPLLPDYSPEQLLAAAREAVQYNHSLGITAWLEAGGVRLRVAGVPAAGRPRRAQFAGHGAAAGDGEDPLSGVGRGPEKTRRL